ncbi:hypothetical protein D3C78_1152890 [compost metagenome]
MLVLQDERVELVNRLTIVLIWRIMLEMIRMMFLRIVGYYWISLGLKLVHGHALNKCTENE